MSVEEGKALADMYKTVPRRHPKINGGGRSDRWWLDWQPSREPTHGPAVCRLK